MEYSWFIIIFLLLSCSKDPISNSTLDLSDQSLPDSVLIKSNEYIISRVGEKFFDAYISFDFFIYSEADSFCIEYPDKCSPFLQHPNYFMVYNFIIPEKSFVDEKIEFSVDTMGRFFPGSDSGIPNCPNNECWENFPIIDEGLAIQIAHDAGLEEGIREWRT